MAAYGSGHEAARLSSSKLRQMRRHMQFVLQNPYSSLHPRMTIAQTLTELPEDKANEVMELVAALESDDDVQNVYSNMA